MVDQERTPAPDGEIDSAGSEIAIVGMACRFPGARTIEEFWENLRNGVESLRELSDEELLAAGATPEEIGDPSYVRRASVLEGIEDFDAHFFGYTPQEAVIMDPQHRLFLECAWEAFEQAGYDPAAYPRPVGVFTGAKTNTYLFQVVAHRARFPGLDNFQIALGNDLAAMATRVSYKFDLRGPSYALHTACSTSLVAVHLACQSLLLDECEMALAGGAAINVPQYRGYSYRSGGLLSPDGSCRTFAEDAAGSNFGNGVGAVLLKRLDDAHRDGDTIYAVIRGSATNNDGAAKASFTAPGVEGQTAVLLEAMAVAGLVAEDISYVEAHGTATEIGDAIEMLALTHAFRASTKRRGDCAIGSAKTNLGHLETTAGLAGLIKTALALYHRELPPSLHFERPHPDIDFASSPFYVNTELVPWPEPAVGRRRIAGVSSFGIGSTNAHALLEEPPEATTTPVRGPQQLLLSAPTATALEAMSARLARHLEARPELDLADVAYTLAVGRRRFEHRRALACRDPEEAVKLLRRGAARPATPRDGSVERPVVFLLPGLGDQRLDLARGLYEVDATFRRELDGAFDLLGALAGQDLRKVLYPGEMPAPSDRPDLRRMLGRDPAPVEPGSAQLDTTRWAQPALFAVEYALARMWIAWGVRPRVMIGHSLGEYVSACLAGVLRLEDALTLVVRRSQLIDELPAGAMLAVPIAAEELPRLGAELSLAAVNGAALTVVSGTPAAVAALAEEFGGRGVACQRLATSHAFHSRLMEEVRERLVEEARRLEHHPPEIPYVSNVTGTWITAEEATDPEYWGRHLCGTVRFSDGIATLLADSAPAMLEMGTGKSLLTFVKLHPDCDPDQAARTVATLPGALDDKGDALAARQALGRLWCAGVDVDWTAHYAGQRRRRVPLPTYPFERRRYWLDPVSEEELAKTTGTVATPAASVSVTLEKKTEISDWFYLPVWRAEELSAAVADPAAPGTTLVFSDGGDLPTRLTARLRAQGGEVIEVRPAGSAARANGGQRDGEAELLRMEDGRFALVPDHPEGYRALLGELRARGQTPADIFHLWTLPRAASCPDPVARGFYSLLFLAQALGREGSSTPVAVTLATSGVHRVSADDPLEPSKAPLLGPAKVIPQEMPGLRCRVVDVDLATPREALVDALLAEHALTAADPAAHEPVAYRAGRRYQQSFERMSLEEAPPGGKPLKGGALKKNGVYLITGGLGGLGLVLAEHLARNYAARLVLLGRSAFPEPETWDARPAGDGASDAIRAKMTTLREMEAAGAEVLVLRGDVAERDDMEAVRSAARARFGRIDGIIHAAGIPGGGIVQLKTRAAAEAILRPKVDGLDALAEVFAGDPLDFLLIYSSIASILGEYGQADYCGANAFLDAFAQSRAGKTPRVVAVNWDIWNEVGLAVYTEVPPHLQAWREEMLAKGIRSREGVVAFERALAAGQPQVVVSTQDLPGRIELGKSFTGERFLKELGMAPAAAPAPGNARTPIAAAERPQLERRIAEIWREVLGVAARPADNFFDLGGNSLVGLQLVNRLNHELGSDLSPVELFEHPSVAALTHHLAPAAEEEARSPAARIRRAQGEEIAIVGMAGRFPGSRDVAELWENLRNGVESVRFFTDEELLRSGVDTELLDDPAYVRAGSVIDDIDLFDAALFGYSPREAEVMDPQQRIFLECAWEALESAACDPERYAGRVGVFAGANLSTYLLALHADPALRGSLNLLQTILGNDKDALTTRASYKLGLKGPSIAVQTFCSTSLVAVHMAARSLLDGDCDTALAGGIRVVVPAEQGYLYEERGIAPRDGHTRSFDAAATGAVLGNGVGIVVLKRLADALAEGDPIRAVIRGSAVNNDGGAKAGYTAPSVEGQVEVARDALARAGVDPATVSYVEAHGSATELGDPIEVTALGRAYGSAKPRTAPCAIGSIKSNFGHLDRAAGVAGLIKTVLALEHRELPPSLNFEQPNPQIDFAAGPFRVQAELAAWERNGEPLRAGVNSLGMGGTNAHVIVEEAPAGAAEKEEAPASAWQLLVLSAHSPRSLDGACRRLAAHLARRPELSLRDVAWTLQSGRRQLSYRRTLVCRDTAEAAAALGGDSKRLLGGYCEPGQRSLVFLFPGLGGQYAGMGRELYRGEAVFRSRVDRCAAHLEPLLGIDIRTVLYPEGVDEEGPAAAPRLDMKALLRRDRPRGESEPGGDVEPRRLERTLYAQPALFVVQYALAELWRSWGLTPSALVGYSLGEYVAACLAGVLSLEDALALVARRARLLEALPEGGMVALALSGEETEARLAAWPDLSLAARNTPAQTVVAGPREPLEAFEEKLAEDGVVARRLEVAHAFHSEMLRPAFDDLVALAGGFSLSPPEIPCISNVTGTWLSPEDATDPSYWARHMCAPVRFAEGLREVLAEGAPVLLEVGPQVLASLVLQNSAPDEAPPPVAVALRHAYERGSDAAHLLDAAGKLWLAGIEIDWRAIHRRAATEEEENETETLRRLVLPTYAFDRQRYWIGAVTNAPARPSAAPEKSTGDEAPAAPGAYDRPRLRTEYTAPRTPTEEKIAGLWSEMLGVREVGAHDPFLELGGDSLLASRLVARLREVFELDLPIRLFFEASTVAELAAAVERLREEEEQREIVELAARVGRMSDEEIEREIAELQEL